MTLATALGRTLLIMRTHLRPEIPDETLLAALTSTRVVLHPGAMPGTHTQARRRWSRPR